MSMPACSASNYLTNWSASSLQSKFLLIRRSDALSYSRCQDTLEFIMSDAIQFLRLWNAINTYYLHSNMMQHLAFLELQPDEWELAQYFLVLIYPFAIKGYTICAKMHPIINLVWDTYNSLFQNLEDKKETLKKVKSLCHSTVIWAIEAVNSKLAKY